MAQEDSTPEVLPARTKAVGHRWVAGQPSANPRGRPPTGLAWAEYDREVAGRREVAIELINQLLDCAFGSTICIDPEWQRACRVARREGRPMPPRPERGESVQPTLDQQHRAMQLLIGWGFKMPAVELQASVQRGEVGFDYDVLSEDELDQLEALHRKALNRGASPESQGATQAHALPSGESK